MAQQVVVTIQGMEKGPDLRGLADPGLCRAPQLRPNCFTQQASPNPSSSNFSEVPIIVTGRVFTRNIKGCSGVE